jgi:hypothetical protein
VTDHTVTVISETVCQILSSHSIDPNRNYWRNKQNRPGRWPGQPVTDDAAQM